MKCPNNLITIQINPYTTLIICKQLLTFHQPSIKSKQQLPNTAYHSNKTNQSHRNNISNIKLKIKLRLYTKHQLMAYLIHQSWVFHTYTHSRNLITWIKFLKKNIKSSKGLHITLQDILILKKYHSTSFKISRSFDITI